MKRALCVAASLAALSCGSPHAKDASQVSVGVEEHLEAAVRAHKTKDYDEALSAIERAFDSYDGTRLLELVELDTTGIDLLADLYGKHRPSRDFVDRLTHDFERKPECGAPWSLGAAFYLSLMVRTGVASNIVVTMQSLEHWKDCSTSQRASLVWEFKDLLLANGGAEIVAKQVTGVRKMIDDDLEQRDKNERDAAERSLFLFEALLLAGKQAEALDLGRRWLCEQVPGLGKDLLDLLEKHQMEAPDDLACVNSKSKAGTSSGEQGEPDAPPMTGSAAGEGKDEDKKNDDGESGADKEK